MLLLTNKNCYAVLYIVYIKDNINNIYVLWEHIKQSVQQSDI